MLDLTAVTNALLRLLDSTFADALDSLRTRWAVWLLDRCWRIILGLWAAVVVASMIGPGLAAVITGKQTWSQALSDLVSFPIVGLMRAHPGKALLVVSCGGLFTWLCRRAHAAWERYEGLKKLRGEFIVERVRVVKPERLQILMYQKDLYVKRGVVGNPVQDATALARKALRACAMPAKDQRIGVFILGRSMQGKTRLAWEAMRPELADWTLVRWPLAASASTAFDLDLFRGRRVALWLDDLNRYATDTSALTLNGLPQRFASAGVPLAIIATCRDEQQEKLARERLQALLGQLHEVQPADIDSDDARKIADGVAKLQVSAGATAKDISSVADSLFRQWDEKTPGSIALGPTYKRDTVAVLLPQEALWILWALQLMHSAKIDTFWEKSVKANCEALFQWPSADGASFTRARQQLEEQNYITIKEWPEPPDSDAAKPVPLFRGIREFLIPDTYLENGIPTYAGWYGDITSAWPQMEMALAQASDAGALSILGLEYYRRSRNTNVSLADQLALRRRAEACLRQAQTLYAPQRDQTPIEWVSVIHNLAATLHAQTHCLPLYEPKRYDKVKELLNEAWEYADEAEMYCIQRMSEPGANVEGWKIRLQQVRETRDRIWNALKDLKVLKKEM